MQQSRLRIVQAIFTNGFAGSERITVDLCNELAERHDVLLVVANDADEHDGHSILEHVSDKVTVRKISRGFRHFRMAYEVWRFRADVYHAHLGRAVDYAWLLSSRVRRVATWHMGRPVKAKWLDGVVLISDWQHSLLPDENNFAYRVVNNWVPPVPRASDQRLAELRNEFNIGPDDFIVGFVGRPSPFKGIHEAVEAFRLWGKRDVHMIIVGGTVDGVQYQRRPDDLNIHVTGHRTDVYDFYSLIDCLVAPSYAEPFGLVAIEAMSAGCRVIVRDSCGLHDIAALNKDVIALPMSDPELIVDAMKMAYDLRQVPPQYDMTPYDRDARVADIEAFYRAL